MPLLHAIPSPQRPEVYATRLDETGMGRGRVAVAGPARRQGFEVELYGAIGFLPAGDRVASFRLVGYKRGNADFGMRAFDCLWLGGRPPTCRVLFYGWPWRTSTVTELVRMLKTTR